MVVSGVGSSRLNLRATPGGEVIVRLQEGAPLDVFEQREVYETMVWALVRDEEGQMGWVVTSFLVAP